MNRETTIHIGFFVFPRFVLLDLSGPLCAFELANRHAGGSYRLTVVSQSGGVVTGSGGVGVTTERLEGHLYDSLIIVGGPPKRACGLGEEVVALLRSKAAGMRRVASVCTGAFLLAATGLLDGKRVTTHWRNARRLQTLYPALRVDAEPIFVQDGRVWTSAGVTAGIDLALSLIEEDLSTEVARKVARDLVVYHRRLGSQSQYSNLLDLDPSSDRIRHVLAFARDHLHEPLPVERLAKEAHLSPRQFSRAFLAETGETPAKAVERLRVEAARLQVEESTESIEVIAERVGFADPERMRQSFLRAFGSPPQALRRSARAASRGPRAGGVGVLSLGVPKAGENVLSVLFCLAHSQVYGERWRAFNRERPLKPGAEPRRGEDPRSGRSADEETKGLGTKDDGCI